MKHIIENVEIDRNVGCNVLDVGATNRHKTVYYWIFKKKKKKRGKKKPVNQAEM